MSFPTLFQDAGESDGIVQVEHVSNEVNIINIYIKYVRIRQQSLIRDESIVYDEI